MRCYCAATRQVARRLTRFYEAELRSVGMSATQFELMANLRGRPGVSQSELASVMDVDQTTLSRNLKLLVGLGWVSAGASATDGRRSEYALTREGLRVFRRAVPCWERAMAKVEERLGGKASGIWGMLERLGAAGGVLEKLIKSDGNNSLILYVLANMAIAYVELSKNHRPGGSAPAVLYNPVPAVPHKRQFMNTLQQSHAFYKTFWTFGH